MADPQLALLLCRLLHGGAGSPAEQRLLQQLREAAEGAGSSDAAAAAAACCWLQGDADSALGLMLRAERAGLQAASSAEHAAQLLPLLRLLLAAAPLRSAEQRADRRCQLRSCLAALAAALQGCGLHALAVQAAAAAQLGGVPGGSGPAGRHHHLLGHLLAVALLPGVLEQAGLGSRHPEGDAAHQLELLQQQGVAVDAPAVLARLRRLRRAVLAPCGGGRESGAWGVPGAAPPPRPLERQHSSGGSSYRSRDSEQARWGQQRHGTAVVGDGYAPSRTRMLPYPLLCRPCVRLAVPRSLVSVAGWAVPSNSHPGWPGLGLHQPSAALLCCSPAAKSCSGWTTTSWKGWPAAHSCRQAGTLEGGGAASHKGAVDGRKRPGVES